MDIKIKRCENCARWMYYKRSTKQYCSSRCRKHIQRGNDPTNVWKNIASDREKLAAEIADFSPRAYRQLERVRDTHGTPAMLKCLDAIAALLEASK